jgi:hypothetical protein
MVQSEEIVERTFYVSLLSTAVKMGYTINPDDYLPASPENEQRYNADKNSIENFVSIFGVGNNHARGAKIAPRITVNLNAYYPGMIGMEKFGIEADQGNQFNLIEYPFETKDISIDIHLVAKNMQELRILHNIMYRALPARGYIRPYLNNYYEWISQKVLPSGNLYIEIANWYDYDDKEHGLLEKVYNYTCVDGVLNEYHDEEITIAPINDILTLIGTYDKEENDMLPLHISE